MYNIILIKQAMCIIAFLTLWLLLITNSYVKQNTLLTPIDSVDSVDLVGYSPTSCTITNYMLTFIYDDNSSSFKVHGLWPEECAECVECSYPSCCNIDDVIYEYPYDPTNFIDNYWYNTTTTESCTGEENVILFEHEYYKHISCTDIGNTTNFLNLTMDLYDYYYDDYVNGKCNGYDELWLNLDANYDYILTECM